MVKPAAAYTYSAAELAALFDEAIAKLAFRKRTIILGETVEQEDLPELIKARDKFKAEASQGNGPAVNLAQFVRRS